MVAIKDMEMPSRCMNCGLLGKEKMYCSIYPRRDLDIITVATNRPNWCPLVEIEERKVGKWIKTILTEVSGGDFKRGFKCSHCNYVIVTNDFNFCPNCGAEMRGSSDGSN